MATVFRSTAAWQLTPGQSHCGGKIQAFKIEISLDCEGLHQSREQHDRCLMEILVEDHKVGDNAPQRVKRVRKHQEVMFLSIIATAEGKKWTATMRRTGRWATRGYQGSAGRTWSSEENTQQKKTSSADSIVNIGRYCCLLIDGSADLTASGSTGWTRRETS